MVEMMEIQPHEVGAKGDKDSPTRSPLTFKVCYFLNSLIICLILNETIDDHNISVVG